MATATDKSERDNEDGDKWISLRASEKLKRLSAMRASELGMARSEYVRELIRSDLEDVEYADL